MDTGKTVKHIKKSIKAELNDGAVCIGFLAVQELAGTGECWERKELINVDKY